MLKKLFRWLRGYLFIGLYGTFPERFLNLCNHRGINLWGVVTKGNQQYCFIRLSDYRKVKDIAKKSHIKPYIKQRLGFPFFVQRMKKHKALCLAVFMFVALVYTLSLFIWDITIEGSYKHTPEELYEFLETNNIYTGIRIKDVSCQQIEDDIRREFTDIGWVSAEIVGTKLIVRINETTLPILSTDQKKTNLKTGHIVATKDCIISNIITRVGMPKVQIGSIVKAGDVLISGIIPVIGDNGEVIENRLKLADGDITCKTYYDYNDQFNMKYIYRAYTGEEKKGYQVAILDNKLFSYNPRYSYDNCDIITEVKTLKLLRNFYLPIKYKETRYCEYVKEDRVYTQAQASEIANKRLLTYLENLTKNGVTVIENHVVISIKKGKCVASGKIIVEESAWKYKQIEEEEWRIINTDEHSGDDN